MKNLPLDVAKHIASFSPAAWYRLALVRLDFGLFTLDDEIQRKAKDAFATYTFQCGLGFSRLPNKLLHGPFRRYEKGQVVSERWFIEGRAA